MQCQFSLKKKQFSFLKHVFHLSGGYISYTEVQKYIITHNDQKGSCPVLIADLEFNMAQRA